METISKTPRTRGVIGIEEFFGLLPRIAAAHEKPHRFDGIEP